MNISNENNKTNEAAQQKTISVTRTVKNICDDCGAVAVRLIFSRFE